MSAEDVGAAPKLYLLDIEGTVAPLSLTTEVLFPYARAHFAEFLQRSMDEVSARGAVAGQMLTERTVLQDLIALVLENRAEKDPDAPRMAPWPFVDEPGNEVVASFTPTALFERSLTYIDWLMDRDRKSTALKSLQGKIWKAGFESGELKGELFTDVPDALKRWSAEAKTAIYSSGSVEAQQLLFRYSNYGDLTPLLSGYFDTRTGPKKESASYTAIAAAMGIAPDEAIFFSDVVQELDAAREAGCQTRLVVRPGNAVVEDAHGHTIIESFDGL